MERSLKEVLNRQECLLLKRDSRGSVFVCLQLFCVFSDQVVLDLAREHNVSVSWMRLITHTCRLEIY